RADVIWIGGQPFLGLEREPHRADRRHAAVRAEYRLHRLIVLAGDLGGEHARLKAGAVEQVVHEQSALARLRIGLGEYLQRRDAVRTAVERRQSLRERLRGALARQRRDVAATAERRRARARMAR